VRDAVRLAGCAASNTVIATERLPDDAVLLKFADYVVRRPHD
jgi:hypothetical protein